MSGAGETLLDLRGMRCPWPALRVGRALREAEAEAEAGAEAGAVVIAVADDPAAPREIAAVAGERGWHIGETSSPIGPALRLSRL